MQAIYENLPVYKKAYDLTTHFEKVVKGFNRFHRYAIGTDLRSLSMRILVLVAKANTKDRRVKCLEEAIGLLEELKIIVRVSRDVGAFKSFRSFEFASKSVIDISKQCEGWKRGQIS